MLLGKAVTSSSYNAYKILLITSSERAEEGEIKYEPTGTMHIITKYAGYLKC